MCSSGATGENGNEQLLQVNGKQLHVNGHSHGHHQLPLQTNGTHAKVNGNYYSNGSVVPGEPVVDARLLRAFVEGGIDALGSMEVDDVVAGAGVPDDLDEELPQQQPSDGAGLFRRAKPGDGEGPPTPPGTQKVWRNGRLVSPHDPTVDQPEP
jgi:hypothetical protein